jgi:hypothetical protein
MVEPENLRYTMIALNNGIGAIPALGSVIIQFGSYERRPLG